MRKMRKNKNSGYQSPRFASWGWAPCCWNSHNASHQWTTNGRACAAAGFNIRYKGRWGVGHCPTQTGWTVLWSLSPSFLDGNLTGSKRHDTFQGWVWCPSPVLHPKTKGHCEQWAPKSLRASTYGHSEPQTQSHPRTRSHAHSQPDVTQKSHCKKRAKLAKNGQKCSIISIGGHNCQRWHKECQTWTKVARSGQMCSIFPVMPSHARSRSVTPSHPAIS